MKKPRKHALGSFIREKKLLLTVFIGATIVLSVAAPLKSYIMQWLIDSQSKAQALRYMLLGIGVVLVSHVSEYICRDSFTKIACKSIEQVRNRLIERQVRKPMKEYLSESSGEMLSCMTNDIRLLYDDYYMGIFNIIMWGCMGLAAMIMMATISPILLVLAVAMCALPLIAPKVMSGPMSRVRDAYSKDTAVYTGKVGELLKGFEALITANGARYLVRSHGEAAGRNRLKEYAMRKMMNIASVISSLVSWLPGLLVLVVGVFLVFDGKMTIGYLVTAFSLTNFVIAPFRQVSNAYVGLRASTGLKNRVEAAMREETKETGTQSVAGILDIELKNVTFTYPGAGVAALNGISLSIRRGEKLALVGPSGCGKSTIEKILYRYYDDYEGQVLVDGRELGDIRRESYYCKAAMIPQTPFLFSDTIYNNLCLYQEYDAQEVRLAVARAGLKDFVDGHPEGWDATLSEGGRNLSGGQIQRIAIARAVLRRCDLILVDEATSSLDVATTCEIMENLLDLDCTVVVITHDIYGEYMHRFDRIYYLEQGSIREQGNFEALIRQNGRFANLHRKLGIMPKKIISEDGKG